MKCIKCNKEHDSSFGSGKFCSRSCSNSRNHSEETKKAISNKLLGTGRGDITITCKFCKNKKVVEFKKRSQIFCSTSCARRYNVIKNRDLFVNAGIASAANRVIRSKNEICFFDYCSKYFKNTEHNIPLFNGWDADIIIHDIKTAILWNGPWHYKQIGKKHSLKQVQNRDKIKYKEIIKSGYSVYIIKDMGKYNPTFVKEQFEIFLSSITANS